MPQVRIAFLVFLAVFLAGIALTRRAAEEKTEIAARIRKYTSAPGSHEERQESKKKRTPWTALASCFGLLVPRRLLAGVEAELVQADLPLKAEEMIGLTMVLSFGPALLASTLLQNPPLAVILAAGGATLPLLYLKRAKARRLQQFNNQLGDALLIMANSLRAGFSFLQTMDTLSREMTPPISREFSRALREMRLGRPTEDALRNMAERIKSDDLDLIITAVIIQRQVGGNLAEILDNIAFTISERVRIKGEIKTLTAQGRIAGTIVALLPVFLAAVLSILNPAYLYVLIRHPLGLVLVGGAVLSELIGIMVIRKIINIEI
ncbi:MAG: secretion system protein [Firmicutes bacterium]|jgi:tight adherence protein B|nr:secretion system protein [Bacillota bacterium]